MQLIHELEHACLTEPSYVTVGVFDGVHRGHQQLISRMIHAAHSNGALAIAYTFEPHPTAVLGRQPAPLLSTVEERAELLETLGLDYLAVPRFTPETARMPAADFVDMLIRYLHMIELWAGPDFGLGHRRQGNLPYLERLGAERGFAVRVVDRLMCNGIRVSSSSVRAALAEGDITWATHCLGRPYRLTGVGATNGLRDENPVWLNIYAPPQRMVPAPGVYACLAQIPPHRYAAATYIDADAASQPSAIRAQVIGFQPSTGGHKIALDFIARLSDEQIPGMWAADRLDTGPYVQQALASLESHLPQSPESCQVTLP